MAMAMTMHVKRVDRSDTQNTLPGDSHRSVAKSISTENKLNILVVYSFGCMCA